MLNNINDLFAPESITAIVAVGMIITKIVKAMYDDNHHTDGKQVKHNDNITINKDLLSLNQNLFKDIEALRAENKLIKEKLAFYEEQSKKKRK